MTAPHEECNIFHKSIKDKDIEQLRFDIDELIEKYPEDKLFENDEGKSAVAFALECENIKAYELLISRGLWFWPYENADEIMNSWGLANDDWILKKKKTQVREINKNHAPHVIDHIAILVQKTKALSTDESTETGKYIREAFEDLDQIEWIKPILEVVATADKRSIIFDFSKNAINNMDPEADSGVRGCYYPTGKGEIFIGAEYLKRTEKNYYCEALGTLAHELTHYAMELIYQNDCKPYERTSSEQAFVEILEACRKKKDMEEIIDRVFRYSESQQQAELIVRVPHLLALYKVYGDQGKEDKEVKGKFTQCEKVKSTFKELFEYFEKKTLKDIESVLPHKKVVHRLNAAFPQRGDLIEYYIPRVFVPLNENFKEILAEHKTEDLLIDHTKNHKAILVSDQPGAGKTTNLRAMSEKLKGKYPERWIAFIDLKKFAASYHKDGNASTFFNSTTEIAKFYCDKIFIFKHFEAINFSKLFELNRVIFLMDGFDEINPSFKEFNLKLITVILQEKSNQIWISTRTHLEKELREKLNCSVFRLNALTTSDRKQFLELKWKSVDIEKRIERIQKVENFIEEWLKKSWRSDVTNLLSNPLILNLLAEIFEDSLNPQNLELNLYTIYDTFVDNKLGIYQENGPEAKREITDHLFKRRLDIKAIHHERALSEILEHDSIALSLSFFFEDDAYPSTAEITRPGFMFFDSSLDLLPDLPIRRFRNFQFTHRTFAEFFAADFIVKYISKFKIGDYSKRELEKLENMQNQNPQFLKSGQKTRETIFNEILEYFIDEDLVDNNADVREFIYSFWETLLHEDLSWDQKLKHKLLLVKFFVCSIYDGSNCFLKEQSKILEMKLLSSDFWGPHGWRKQNMLMISSRNSRSFFEEFIDFVSKYDEGRKLRDMFFDIDFEGKNMFFLCSRENFKFVLSDPKLPLKLEEKRKLLLATDNQGRNIFFNRSLDIFEFRFILNDPSIPLKLEEKKALLQDKDNLGQTIFFECSEETLKFILSDASILDHKEKIDLFKVTDKEGNNVIGWYNILFTENYYKKLIELIKNFDGDLLEILLNDHSSETQVKKMRLS